MGIAIDNTTFVSLDAITPAEHVVRDVTRTRELELFVIPDGTATAGVFDISLEMQGRPSDLFSVGSIDIATATDLLKIWRSMGAVRVWATPVGYNGVDFETDLYASEEF